MWVKVCGINDVTTAAWVTELAPDAIGLNFFQRSPRLVDEATAKAIAQSLPDNVEAVGVFVDLPVRDIIRLCRHCSIGTAQLHGDYSRNDVAACRDADLRVIHVVRLRGDEWPNDLNAELDWHARQSDGTLRCLVDAQVPGAWGGTGQTVSWKVLKSHWQPDWPPLILAGGLTPDNVREAITQVQPFGVDVASGVESAPAIKDRSKVQQFIHQARLTAPSS